jgi:hypothetical protein
MLLLEGHETRPRLESFPIWGGMAWLKESVALQRVVERGQVDATVTDKDYQWFCIGTKPVPWLDRNLVTDMTWKVTVM